jgi:hypothetical protein
MQAQKIASGPQPVTAIPIQPPQIILQVAVPHDSVPHNYRGIAARHQPFAMMCPS